MKGALFLVGLGLVTVVTPSVRANGHYGSRGVQAGFYRYPAPGGSHAGSFGVQMGVYRHPAPAAGFAPMMLAPAAGCSGAGFAPTYGYAPMMAAPSYGYAPMMAAPSYAPMMMAPAAGCGGGAFAPSYGYGYSPSYGYGYGASYGYGAPQAGLLQVVGAVGGVRDTIRALKEIREAFEELGGGKVDAATKTELEKLREEVKGLRSDLSTLKVPDNLEERFRTITKTQEAIRLDLLKLSDEFKKHKH